MGYSRQDYGDYGAASLGNSCYKTPRERATLPGRWEEIKAHLIQSYGNKSTPKYVSMCLNVLGLRNKTVHLYQYYNRTCAFCLILFGDV